jgi:hypothetical protein
MKVVALAFASLALVLAGCGAVGQSTEGGSAEGKGHRQLRHPAAQHDLAREAAERDPQPDGLFPLGHQPARARALPLQARPPRVGEMPAE